MTNTNLLIHIREKDGEGSYPVEAEMSDGSRFTGGRFKPDMEALHDAALDPEKYGETLFYALFDGPIRRAYDRALGRAGDSVLRIQLWIDQKAASLHALNWERLHHVSQELAGPLATSAKTPFSRYFSLEQAHVAPISERPARIVVVLSNPTGLKEDYGLQPLDVEQEIVTLVKALGNASRADQLRVTLMPGRTKLPESARTEVEKLDWQIADGNATLDNVLRTLDADGGAHALHVVAHGAFRSSDGTAVLFLEDEEGAVKITPDWDIVKRLRDVASPPHLVFLASCESAERNPTNPNPFVGLAPKLVRTGVPAVVAMQDKVPVATARELTHDFYRYLLDHGEVDRALNQARLLLYEEDSPAWAIPVLFTHLPDGQLLTADPVRTALEKMVLHERFNPLSPDQSYIPVNALHLSGKLDAVDLERLCRERAPGQEVLAAFQDILSREGDAFVALIGNAGMGKSLQLRRLGYHTAKDSLEPEAARVVIPVYIDLLRLRKEPLVGPADIEDLIVKGLRAFWPEGRIPHLTELITTDDGPILRLLIDGSDALPDHQRHRIWAALDQFARRRPQHQYVVACKSVYFAPNRLPFTEALVMQRLSPKTVSYYLEEKLGTPPARRLYGAIERGGLHDLAAFPWLLITMLNQTEKSGPPQSHVDVLSHYVEDAVIKIATDPGMRVHVEHTLDALAWRMQSTFRSEIPIDEAFEIMAAERGNRGYDLEHFFSDLVEHDLLVPVGLESLTFARDVLRSHCCARYIERQEEHMSLLDDILATLGRKSRYRWWEDTLTLLAGLENAPSSLLLSLLQDVFLGDGEEVFLAARMLRECNKNVDAYLQNYVIGALLTRLDAQREPHIRLRAQSAEVLGYLGGDNVVPRLISIAVEKVRGTEDEPKLEYATVRLAAMLALRRTVSPPFAEIAEHNKALATLMQQWDAEDVEALSATLQGASTDPGIQALAAFILGELETPGAVNVLVETFLDPDQDTSLYRNVSTALTLIDPAEVSRRVILPLLEEADGDPGEIGARLANLIYLIGRLRVPAEEARAFLQRCLRECAKIQLKGLVIQSLGWLHAVEHKQALESIALGDFEALRLVGPLSDSTRRYLQRKALESLVYVGDTTSLEKLKQRAFTWDPELEMAFYRTSEEILARNKEQIRNG